jgi:C4-dicarboxylate-specific signal transduction histidine kinase
VLSPPPSILLAAAGVQLTLCVALAAQWRRNRRNGAILARKLSGIDARAGSLVHELNQPLTAILSNAQAAQKFLAAEPVDLQEVREIIADIVSDDKRAAGIVRRIGCLSRVGRVDAAPGHHPKDDHSDDRCMYKEGV